MKKYTAFIKGTQRICLNFLDISKVPNKSQEDEAVLGKASVS